ncbi:hypothetical protein BN1723_003664 [Verticillium longisporum]|uniref:Uncharacterized protein n=1 Tax=Verticillium longisporum TaxID=100787 RepID=A0A0G4M6D0_VERLO|nr:hypothetical protein BN1723_003664 [Verticillium longisporum]
MSHYYILLLTAHSSCPSFLALLGYHIKCDIKPWSRQPPLARWRGCMLEGVPNAAAVMGYVAGTWTPGADAVTSIALRVYGHMRAAGAERATPVVDLDAAERKAAPKLPVMDMKSNYFAVARNRLPMSMERGPWYGRKNIVKDKAALWFGDVTTGIRYDGGKVKSV